MSIDFSTVKSWNIPEGEVLSASLNGVQVWEKQSPTPTWNDVTFIDYDGTILYSYSAADFLNLSSLPANYDHTPLGDGLGQGSWNVESLDIAKNQVRKCGKAIIGQTCQLLNTQRIDDLVSDTKPCFTIFYDNVSRSNYIVSYRALYTSNYTLCYDDGFSATKINPTQAVSTAIGIDKTGYTSGVITVSGKYSSIPNSIIGLSDQTQTSALNYGVYSPIGSSKDTDEIIIAKKVTKLYMSPCTYLFDSNSINRLYNYGNLQHVNFAYHATDNFHGNSSSIYASSFLYGAGITELVLPLNFPIYKYSGSYNYYTLCQSANNLKYISYPLKNLYASSDNSHYIPAIQNAQSLEKLYVPYSIFKMSGVCNGGCTSLKEVILPCGPLNNNGEEQSAYRLQINSCFNDCTSLESIKFTRSYGNGSDASKLITIGGSSFRNLPTTCKIYVPQSCLSAYKSISGMPDPTVYEYIGY